MKYLVLIGDGMSDLPLKALGGKTPLEVAKTPNLDFMARNGLVGWTNNVPPKMPPGSDVAAMSIFGYDPKKYYSGRGPLEAASLGIKLRNNELAFRCNLVTVKDGKMKDFTAGHISTKEADKIIRQLNAKLGSKDVCFYTGVSYRHIMTIMTNDKCQMSNVGTTPPHDITGQCIHDYLPKGKGSEAILRLMNEGEVILHDLKSKANMIWLWGQGTAPTMPTFKKQFGKSGAIITAVGLLKGIGKIIGLEVIKVPGATGYLDTNYVGKAKAALRALKKHDVVFVHVEAPDEAGHEGNIKHKIKAIEDFDKYVVGNILNHSLIPGSPDTRILVLPDHPTPIKYMTHTADDVPFVIYDGKGGQGMARKGIQGYNEKEARKAKLKIVRGSQLLKNLFS
ncbi:MAG: cofactor-independent phosphoglycerate mutase [Candidatus Margulisiibacteriota bacterium]